MAFVHVVGIVTRSSLSNIVCVSVWASEKQTAIWDWLCGRRITESAVRDNRDGARGTWKSRQIVIRFWRLWGGEGRKEGHILSLGKFGKVPGESSSQSHPLRASPEQVCLNILLHCWLGEGHGKHSLIQRQGWISEGSNQDPQSTTLSLERILEGPLHSRQALG